MTRRLTAFAFAFSGALMVPTGCGGSADSSDSTAPPAVELVGPHEFAARLDGADVVVLNVHTPYEGEIAGTDLFVPFDQVRSSDGLPADKARPLLVYCRSGNMSADATADLAELGYSDVTDLAGGMKAWEAAGRAIDIVPEHRDRP